MTPRVSVPWTGCFSVCGLRPPPGRPSLWSPGSPCRWWSARRRSAGRGTWSTSLSVGGNQRKKKLKPILKCCSILDLNTFVLPPPLTFILDAFFPPRMALSSKENSFSLMTARLSLSPTYVTTYMSGAHISNSLSQLMMVESGALTRNGPLEWPWGGERGSVHHVLQTSGPLPLLVLLLTSNQLIHHFRNIATSCVCFIRLQWMSNKIMSRTLWMIDVKCSGSGF